MTVDEVIQQFHVDRKILEDYQKRGLLSRDTTGASLEYGEADLSRIGLISSLQETGFDMDTLEYFLSLLDAGVKTKNERIRVLKRQRCRLLEKIHEWQQALDKLDYMIYEIKNAI